MSDINLLPCPKCGGPADMIQTNLHYSPAWLISCKQKWEKCNFQVECTDEKILPMMWNLIPRCD